MLRVKVSKSCHFRNHKAVLLHPLSMNGDFIRSQVLATRLKQCFRTLPLVLLIIAGWHYAATQYRRDFSLVVSSHLDVASVRVTVNGVNDQSIPYNPQTRSFAQVAAQDWLTVRKQLATFAGQPRALLAFHPVLGGARSLLFPRSNKRRLRVVYGFSDEISKNESGGDLVFTVALVDSPGFSREFMVKSTEGSLQSVDLELPALKSPEKLSLLRFTVEPQRQDVAHNWFFFDAYLW